MPNTTTRDKVLQAALECVAADGLEGTTIERIRERSGVSVGSIYHHFGGRLGILAALYVDGIADHGSRALDALCRTQTLEAGVDALIRTYLQWLAEHPAWGRFLLSARALVEREAAAGLKERNRSYFKRLRRWLEHWPETRALARQPVLVLAQIYGPVDYLARLWLDGVLPDNPLEDLPRLTEAATAALVRTGVDSTTRG